LLLRSHKESSCIKVEHRISLPRLNLKGLHFSRPLLVPLQGAVVAIESAFHAADSRPISSCLVGWL
ncbi:hypothetical protein S83_066742, partial [Arachis hypogaea]